MCGGIVELGRVVDRQGSLDSLSYKELSLSLYLAWWIFTSNKYLL